MRYKCHYCGKFLRPGSKFMLECECNNCALNLAPNGEINEFQLTFFEGGKDILIFKSKYSNNVTYGIGRNLYRTNLEKIILELPVQLTIDSDGMPEAYKLWSKLKNLVIFS